MKQYMGTEVEIGCLGCKKKIWLGSMKPYKWKGFQIPDNDVYRFLSLHSNNHNPNCKLQYLQDGRDEGYPWSEEIDGDKSWEEDINSRWFWNSHSEEGMICGHCKKLLSDINGNEIVPNAIEKNSRSWFCDETCFENYKAFYEKKLNIRIYDSTKDIGVKSSSNIIEVGCTQCKSYTIINNKKDECGTFKDYEFLHLFLMEHSFDKNLIVFIGDYTTAETPWTNELTKQLWEEYKELE